MWFIGVEVEQETSAPLPKKNPGSAPAAWLQSGGHDLLTLDTVLKNSSSGKFVYN